MDADEHFLNRWLFTEEATFHFSGKGPNLDPETPYWSLEVRDFLNRTFNANWCGGGGPIA
jgi:hypothetical protein